MVSRFPTKVPRQFNGGKDSFFNKGVGTTGYPHLKKKREREFLGDPVVRTRCFHC